MELRYFHFINETEVGFNTNQDRIDFFNGLYQAIDRTKTSKLLLSVANALSKGEYECVAHCNIFNDILSEIEYVDRVGNVLEEYIDNLWGCDIGF